MANETDTGLMGQDTTAEALIALAARPFDPATLLTAPPVRAQPFAAGPALDPVRTFDPATLLGDAARRGPAMIGDGKPLVARIGGVEVVTVPLEHYAALLSPLQLARPGIVEGERQPNADGMLLFLLSLHAEGAVSIGQLAQATGLDHLDLGDRIAAYAAAQPQPWTGELGADGTIRGTTGEGQRFVMVPEPEPAKADPTPVVVAPTPEEATIDLPSGAPEVVATPAEQADEYHRGTRDGKKRGGAMGRKGQPDNHEPDPHDAPGTGTHRARHLPM